MCQSGVKDWDYSETVTFIESILFSKKSAATFICKITFFQPVGLVYCAVH